LSQEGHRLNADTGIVTCLKVMGSVHFEVRAESLNIVSGTPYPAITEF